MKMITLFMISMALNTVAMASDTFVPAELGLHKTCVAQILREVSKECNADSKKDESRVHGCFASQSEVTSNTKETANFELEFTVTDADVYAYIIDVTDKDSCEFTVKSDN